MNRRRTTVKEVHHGRTPAAWAGSVTALIAFIVLTIAFLMGPGGFPSINVPIAIAGGVLLVLAPIIGGIMAKLGHGQD
ncbi:MAG: HGxxPAAW family protein [Propionibacteriaceae bacterium]|nr:HGxxPAAW family protein [Propionibacteriaceae bacterium]